ncbi:MAG: hypothetical protein GX774_02750 [Armatimonadetes bacterium]|jgi:hypothetical protein|nr:hypothetical protein [Armatimonadota bacterium]
MTLLALAMLAAAGEPGPPPAEWPVHGLVQNEDCTNFFYFRRIGAGVDGGALVDRYVDTLADAGVKVLMCNTNARRTNYRSRVWEAFWDGLDPEGPDDQPFLKPMAPAEVARYRQMVESMRALHQQGVDYPARVAARCRQRGISPWISLRMNDVHNNDVLDHPFHGRFWVQNPSFFRQGATGYFANALDYAHPEVRDLYRRLIEESLTYDVDGIELDFMREPHVFSPGQEAAGLPVLTEWLREIRRLVRDTAAKRGRPVRLGVRVPSRPETARAYGLDPVGWAQEGLVDLVVPTPRWATLEFDMPLAQWRRLLQPYRGVMLAGGLEILYQPHPGAPRTTVAPEHAFAAAAAVYAGGADAVYLFNYFQDSSWAPETYQKTLRTLGSRQGVAGAPRWHALTYRDITGPDEAYRPPLPATGASLRFDLPVCPPPPPDWQAQLLLEIEAIDGAPLQPPSARVNGQVCAASQTDPESGSPGRVTYPVPVAALAQRERAQILVTARGGRPIRVVRVEVRLQPPASS